MGTRGARRGSDSNSRTDGPCTPSSTAMSFSPGSGAWNLHPARVEVGEDLPGLRHVVVPALLLEEGNDRLELGARQLPVLREGVRDAQVPPGPRLVHMVVQLLVEIRRRLQERTRRGVVAQQAL